MTRASRAQIARDSYAAFAAGYRTFFDVHLSHDFTFSSPADPLLDRDGWFERCWPASGRGQAFKFHRVLELGDEVVVTYDLRRLDGTAACNTEMLRFNDENKIARVEVYFGWDLAAE